MEENVQKLIESRSMLTRALSAKNPDPNGIDRYMSLLVHYAGLIGDELADLEKAYEDEKMRAFIANKKTVSVNQADLLARHTEGKGDIAKLTRLVNTSWNTITAAQGRLRRFEREMGVKE